MICMLCTAKQRYLRNWGGENREIQNFVLNSKSQKETQWRRIFSHIVQFYLELRKKKKSVTHRFLFDVFVNSFLKKFAISRSFFRMVEFRRV